MHEVVQRLSKQRSVEVNLFCLNGFDMNHIIYSCAEKNDRHMLCQERHEYHSQALSYWSIVMMLPVEFLTSEFRAKQL